MTHHAWMDVRRAVDAIWPLLSHFPVTSVLATPHLVTVYVSGADQALSLAARLPGADERREHLPGGLTKVHGTVEGTAVLIVGMVVPTGGTATIV